MRKVIITGASGLLGHYLMRTKAPSDDVLGTAFSRGLDHLTKMDVTDKKQCLAVFKEFSPDLVIHCAGDGRVDYAETNPYESFETNAKGTVNVLAAADTVAAKVVYISSNAIYSGYSPAYSETSEPGAINKYGRIKMSCEQAVFNYPWSSIIIRPIMLFGCPPSGARGNFVTRIVEQLKVGNQVEVVNDNWTQPTYALYAAQVIWQLCKQPTGEFNISPAEKMTLFDFAQLIADEYSLDKSLIVPIAAASLKNLAPRPHDPTFNTKKLNEMLISIASPRAGLKHMKGELFPDVT